MENTLVTIGNKCLESTFIQFGGNFIVAHKRVIVNAVAKYVCFCNGRKEFNIQKNAPHRGVFIRFWLT